MEFKTIVAVLILLGSISLLYFLPHTDLKITPTPTPSEFNTISIEVYRQSNPNISWLEYRDNELKRLDEWYQHENLTIENWSSFTTNKTDSEYRQQTSLYIIGIGGILTSLLLFITRRRKRKGMQATIP